eukprot:4226618-Ditylum_brightwellii.AAC.1
MQGKGCIIVRFITFYCPNIPSSKGTGSAFAKQVKFFEDRGRTADPREEILKDLKELIKECKKNGEQIFLMSITELITKLHVLGPAITQCNTIGEAIDGIWGTAGIKITEGGYLPLCFGYKSDHHLIWGKFSIEYTFGSIDYPLQCPTTRNVWVGDLKGQRKYRTHVSRYLRKHKIKEILIKLLTSRSNIPTSEFIQEYERIESIRARACRIGVQKYRKLYVSGVSSHPEVKNS